MRLPLAALALVACTRTAPVAAPPSHTETPPAPPPVAPPEPAVSLPPDPDPAAFRTGAREVDVDRDGLVDRVLELPELRAEGERMPLLEGLPPAVVAHRLADGRYAVDDDVARGALRSHCPEARWQPPPGEGDAAPGDARYVLPRLFWTGFCARAWGASPDEAERAVRAFAQTPAAGEGTAAFVDPAVRAVRAAVLPITLRAAGDATLRAWRPAPETPASDAAEASPAAPAADPRCATALQTNRQRVAAGNRVAAAYARAHEEIVNPLTLLSGDDVRLCQGTPAGVWRLQYGAARFAPGEEPVTTAPVALVWAPTRGAAVTRAGAYTAEAHAMAGEQPTIEHVFDWDGDGAPEVAVRNTQWEHEASPESPIALYTARGGAVAPYAPARAFEHIEAVRDVDGDGRPDLLVASPWTFVDNCGLDGIPHPGPSLVAHAQADGTFSLRSDVARAWVARQCARAEQVRTAGSVDVFDVACARAWGQVPDEAVRAAWGLTLELRRRAADRAAEEERCMPFPFLAARALLALPFEPLRDDLPRLP